MLRSRGLLGVVTAMVIACAGAARAQPKPQRVPDASVRSSDLLRSARSGALPQGAVKLTAELTPATARTPQLVRMPIVLEGRSAEQLKADPIKLTAGVGRITATAAGDPVLELPANGSAIVSSDRGRASAAQSAIHEGVKTPLPWLVVESKAAEGGAPEVRTARPFLTLARAITWDAAQQKHVADFLFGLDPEQGEPGPLANAIVMRFTVTCDEVDPAAARVGRVGPDGYGTLRVACSPKVKNERRDHHIQVHAGHGNLIYPFEIPHRPGPLALSASASSVLGFGFGSATLTVRKQEEDGSPLAADRDLPVQLSVEGGSIEPSTVTIARGADSASLLVHPHGVGRIVITAQSDAARSQPLAIALTWPLLAVVAMLAGGLLGGVASGLATRKRKLMRRAGEGVLVGVLVTLVVLVLPSFATLPSWARDTELGLLVIAALAGFAGTPLIDRAARALFPVLSEPAAGDKR